MERLLGCGPLATPGAVLEVNRILARSRAGAGRCTEQCADLEDRHSRYQTAKRTVARYRVRMDGDVVREMRGISGTST